MSKRYPGVYRITCLTTGDFYVGSSAYVQSRKSEHFQRLRKQAHANVHLQRAFNRYGEETFVFEVLERPPVEKLIEREQYWIDALAPAYNIRKIAESNLGLKTSEVVRARQRQAWHELSPEEQEKAKQNLAIGRQKMMEMVANGEWQQAPESIEKIKIARAKQVTTPEMLEALKQGQEVRKQVNPKPRQGMTNSLETRQKQSEAARRRKHTPETIEKMRAAKQGTKQSEVAKRKTSESLKGHGVSETNRQKFAERSREMWANRSPEERHAIVKKRSEEVQEKNRQRMRELGKDPDRIERQRQSQLGTKRSEETRQRQREAWERRKQKQLENPKPPVENTQPTKEYKYSDERRARMSAGKKASWDKKKAAQAENIQQSLFD